MREKERGWRRVTVTRMTNDLAFDLDSLAVDVFSLADGDVIVESLTGAHAMTELAASTRCSLSSLCSGSCGCSVAV